MPTDADVKWKKGEVTKVSPGRCMVYGTDAVLYTYYYRTAKSQGRFCKDDEVEFTNVAGEVN